MERQYTFIGSPLDGTEIPVGDPVSLGLELPIPVLGQDRTAVYVFGDDARFHFNRYGPPNLASKNLSEEQHQYLAGIMRRLDATLKELDHFYASWGAYPNQTTLGEWVLIKVPTTTDKK